MRLLPTLPFELEKHCTALLPVLPAPHRQLTPSPAVGTGEVCCLPAERLGSCITMVAAIGRLQHGRARLALCMALHSYTLRCNRRITCDAMQFSIVNAPPLPSAVTESPFGVPQDVAVPMAAHSLANLASAVLWRRQQELSKS